MFDSPDRRPLCAGHFSLPQLARAAAYHARGNCAESSLVVTLADLPSGAPVGVAAGAWWAIERAQHAPAGDDLRFAEWVVGRLRALGVPPASVRRVLDESLEARVDAPVAGTALIPGAPLLQVMGPLPQLLARQTLFKSTVQLGLGAASCARVLARAAAGRPLVDDATVHSPDGTTSPFVAWCGRVGGFSSTTHPLAGWSWEVPVVSVPSLDAPPLEAQDVVVDAENIHESVSRLMRRISSWSAPPRRAQLNRPVQDHEDFARHFRLRRALDRHGLRRVRICGEVAPTANAIRTLIESEAPIDIMVIRRPWWNSRATTSVSVGKPAKPTHPARRTQLSWVGNTLTAGPWNENGLLRPLFGPGHPLPSTPPVLPREHPHRQPGESPSVECVTRSAPSQPPQSSVP